ncbi:MAG: alkaline phosphatase family protein, partial [Anaerolineaceae bacterium]|nr:alkaline phosphatase family protein [Anaerolineaceae bacterium]
MKMYRWMILGILVCLLGAAGAYLLATRQMDSLYAYRSPLRSDPPAPGTALGQPLTRRVVVVLIDALRVDTSLKAEVMPALQGLRRQAAWATVHSQPPSYSEPGYSVLLTGAWPELSDGPAMNLDYADIPALTQDNIFSAARRAGYKTAISAYYWFEKLVPQGDVSAHFYTPGEDAAADRQVVDAAMPWLQNPSYALLLIHIDQVDYAGHHEGGPRDARWDQAAKRSDGLLAEITAQLDLSQDTLLVVSDHGQIDQGGHGGQDPITLIEPFVLIGAGVKPGAASDLQQVDIAPTIAALLGLNVPASTQGQVLTNVLSLSSERVDQIRVAEQAQQDQLWAHYRQALGDSSAGGTPQSPSGSRSEEMARLRDAHLSAQRWPRVILAVIAFLAVLVFLISRRGKALAWMLAGSIVYLVVFNLKYVFLDGRTYSLSSVAGAADLLMAGFVNAAIGLLIGWGVLVVGLRVFARPPGQAAGQVFGFTLTVLALLLAPVLFNFAMNGAWVTWALPDFLTYFLSLLACIQILAVALFGL